MASVSETIVREYFELHGFFVRQQRKFIAPSKLEDEDMVDFFVLNPLSQPAPVPLPFVLSSADLRSVAQAVVVVKGWHTEIFSSGLLASSPAILLRQLLRFRQRTIAPPLWTYLVSHLQVSCRMRRITGLS